MRQRVQLLGRAGLHVHDEYSRALQRERAFVLSCDDLFVALFWPCQPRRCVLTRGVGATQLELRDAIGTCTPARVLRVINCATAQLFTSFSRPSKILLASPCIGIMAVLAVGTKRTRARLAKQITSVALLLGRRGRVARLPRRALPASGAVGVAAVGIGLASVVVVVVVVVAVAVAVASATAAAAVAALALARLALALRSPADGALLAMHRGKAWPPGYQSAPHTTDPKETHLLTFASINGTLGLINCLVFHKRKRRVRTHTHLSHRAKLRKHSFD